jgi:hypothetical protein
MMRALALLLTAVLAALAVGCGSEGKKGEFRDRDKPVRGTKAGAAASPWC